MNKNMALLQRDEAIKFLLEFEDVDHFKIERKTAQSARSYKQVKYFWGVVIKIIKDHHGYNEIEANEILKGMFNKESFTQLSTKEFENVMDIIRQLWKEKFNVDIPKPNE